MNAGKMRVSKRGHTIEPGARHITFWNFGPASEYVECKSEPVFSNLWQSDLCERTWLGLALFPPSGKVFQILNALSCLCRRMFWEQN